MFSTKFTWYIPEYLDSIIPCHYPTKIINNLNPFQNCLKLPLKESVFKNKLVNRKNETMILIFHWITALVYSIDKPWKIIRSWKSSWKMSEMKWKCRVKSNRLFLNLISQSNHLILQVLSQKKVSSENFSSALLRKTPNLVIYHWKECSWGAKLRCPLQTLTHAHLISHSNLIYWFHSRIKNFMQHSQYKKNCFCKSRWRKKFPQGPPIFLSYQFIFLKP